MPTILWIINIEARDNVRFPDKPLLHLALRQSVSRPDDRHTVTMNYMLTAHRLVAVRNAKRAFPGTPPSPAGPYLDSALRSARVSFRNCDHSRSSFSISSSLATMSARLLTRTTPICLSA